MTAYADLLIGDGFHRIGYVEAAPEVNGVVWWFVGHDVALTMGETERVSQWCKRRIEADRQDWRDRKAALAARRGLAARRAL